MALDHAFPSAVATVSQNFLLDPENPVVLAPVSATNPEYEPWPHSFMPDSVKLAPPHAPGSTPETKPNQADRRFSGSANGG